MMVEVDELLREYVSEKPKGLEGTPITRANYKQIVAYLEKKEEESHLLIRTGHAVRFLKDWFDSDDENDDETLL